MHFTDCKYHHTQVEGGSIPTSQEPRNVQRYSRLDSVEGASRTERLVDMNTGQEENVWDWIRFAPIASVCSPLDLCVASQLLVIPAYCGGESIFATLTH